MRKFILLAMTAFLGVFTLESRAQLGLLAGGLGSSLTGGAKEAGPAGPRFSGAMSKLFGENTAFTARMDMAIQEPGGTEPITLPGKVSFLEGKTRFEMDITEAKGTKIPAQAAAQVKAMGMGEIVMISRPDKKLAYMVYPGMQAYMENALDESEAAGPDAKYKVETHELGAEVIEGNACVKNKVLITDEKGNKTEATVWNATGLKNFPLRMQYTEEGRNATITFHQVEFGKPDANVFTPSTKFARYTGMGDLMRGMMMKQFGGGDPPPQAKP